MPEDLFSGIAALAAAAGTSEVDDVLEMLWVGAFELEVLLKLDTPLEESSEPGAADEVDKLALLGNTELAGMELAEAELNGGEVNDVELDVFAMEVLADEEALEELLPCPLLSDDDADNR